MKLDDAIDLRVPAGPFDPAADPARLPILYEDDEEGDLGESNLHVLSDEILHVCLKAHLAARPELQVFSNMNLYYEAPGLPAGQPVPYVSPDTMVVRPTHQLPEDTSSYRIGREGPAPVLVAEILSARSAQQRDLGDKLRLYGLLGVPEYLLVDTSGAFLPERLLLKRLRPDGTWEDYRDADGGVTSALGFRVIIDDDGKVRVVNAATGERYARPDEAQAERVARVRAEERARALEAEVARLRALLPPESKD
jgi:Uma2 family endonuclease